MTTQVRIMPVVNKSKAATDVCKDLFSFQEEENVKNIK
jgi:hypothetical protein